MAVQKVSATVSKVLMSHVSFWDKCRDCNLCQTARFKVFFRGLVPCQVLFIGDTPSQADNDRGFPFSDAAGSLLDAIIGESDISKYRIAFTNSVLCLPPLADPDKGDSPRPSTKDERMACSARLQQFIAICRPELIVNVGRNAEAATTNVFARTGHYVRTLTIHHPNFMLRPGADTAEAKARAILQLNEAAHNIFGK